MYQRCNLKMHSMYFFSSRTPSKLNAKTFLRQLPLALPNRPDARAAKQLAEIQQMKTLEMQSAYSGLMKYRFQGQIVYTLSARSPIEMITAGGLKKSRPHLWLNMANGSNTGCVCFSLLPGLTAVFKRGLKEAYIYAVALNNDYFVPNSKWREIISPGAFPIATDDFFAVRQLLEIKPNGQLKLGPMMGQLGKNNFLQGEHFDQFCRNQLVLPSAINQGDDYPLEFDIIDTAYTAQFQREVADHYTKAEENHGAHRKYQW